MMIPQSSHDYKLIRYFFLIITVYMDVEETRDDLPSAVIKVIRVATIDLHLNVSQEGKKVYLDETPSAI